MKTKAIRLLVFALVCIFGLPTFAQAQNKVTGVVKDSSGTTLTGVSIKVKGGKGLGSTDFDGKFSVTIPGNSAVLEFTSVGFQKQEVSVEAGQNFTVTLSVASSELNEVVVTGFGVKKQTRKLSYATQQINAQELSTAPSPNVLNSLQGKLSGVRIDQGTGGAGSSSRIRIRGNTSLAGNQSPLYVIDGVLIKPATSGPETWADNNNSDQGNILKNLNADDIESISVLKGSAASALYGSDAQNGVVLVTTKKGRSGKGIGVTLNLTNMWDQVYAGPDLQKEFGGGTSPTFAKDAQGNNVVDPTNGAYYNYGPKIDPSVMVKDLDGRMRPWSYYDPIDFYQTGRQQNYNVGLQGGSESGTYRASYSKNITSGIIPNGAEFDRNTFTFRATQKFAKIFNLDVSATYVQTKNQNPLRQVSNYNPLFRMTYYRANTIDWDYWKSNYTNTANGGRISGAAADPYGIGLFLWTTYNNNQFADEDNLRGNVDLTTNILPWLTLLTRANINNYNSLNEYKYLGDGVGYGNGSYRRVASDQKAYRLQAILTGSKDITKDLSLSISLGAEKNRDKIGNILNESTSQGLTLSNPFFFSLANSIGPISTSQTYNPSRLRNAIYSYGDITWRNLLTLNYSVRREYSSTLTYANGTGQYKFTYPSVGASFIFSDLLKDKKAFDFLSYGQLRASYGETGKDIGAWYLNRVGTYTIGGTTEIVTSNGTVTTVPAAGFSGTQLPNKNFKNERTREYEVGLNLKFLNNRLGIDVAAYTKNTYNQVLDLPIPAESGGNTAIFNVGQVRNRGIEVLLNAEPIRSKNFGWNFNVNFTRNRNQIVELADGISTIGLMDAFGNDVRALAEAGKDYGAVYSGYGYAYYQAVDAQGNAVSDPKNGMKVLGNPPNGSNGVTYLRAQDYQYNKVKTNYLGSIMEKFLIGTYQTVRYKNFTVNVQVDAKVGGLMASGTHQYGGSNGSFTYSLFGRDLAHGGIEYTDAQGNKKYDGIIPEGVFAQGITASNGQSLAGMTYKEAYDKGLVLPKPALEYYEDLTQWSSGIREFSVFDNSWVALREVSVGYNLPKSVGSKLHLNNVRLNLIGRNLIYIWKNAKGGINPEGLSSNNAAAFAEYGGIPYVRNLGVSLNADF